MLYVVMVPQKHLQGMLSWRKLNPRLGLPRPKMEVISVRRNCLVQRRQIRVDQQVMVPHIGNVYSFWTHSHIAQTHAHPEFAALNDRAIGRPNDIGFRIRWRRCPGSERR